MWLGARCHRCADYLKEIKVEGLQTVWFQDLGNKSYRQVWQYQEYLLQQTVAVKRANRGTTSPQKTQNHLLFVEHPHVFTLGKSGKQEHLLAAPQVLQQLEAEFVKTNRGGDITYHGPGQLVGYPILDLENFFTDVHKYLRLLEEVIILTLDAYGLKGTRSAGETGVWLDTQTPFARKICAMGIRASRWVSMHGFALNANVDLTYFDAIIPCGIRNKAVTSLQKEVGHPIDMEALKKIVKQNFEKIFDVQIQPLSDAASKFETELWRQQGK